MRVQIDLTEREKQNQKKTEVKETDPILKAFKDVQNQVSTTSQFNFGAKSPKAITKVTLRSHQLVKCNQPICSSATSFYVPTYERHLSERPQATAAKVLNFYADT